MGMPRGQKALTRAEALDPVKPRAEVQTKAGIRGGLSGGSGMFNSAGASGVQGLEAWNEGAADREEVAGWAAPISCTTPHKPSPSPQALYTAALRGAQSPQALLPKFPAWSSVGP